MSNAEERPALRQARHMLSVASKIYESEYAAGKKLTVLQQVAVGRENELRYAPPVLCKVFFENNLGKRLLTIFIEDMLAGGAEFVCWVSEGYRRAFAPDESGLATAMLMGNVKTSEAPGRQEVIIVTMVESRGVSFLFQEINEGKLIGDVIEQDASEATVVGGRMVPESRTPESPEEQRPTVH